MIRLLDRYLLRELLPYFLLSLFLLTAIIFAHESSRFSELLVFYSRQGLPMEAIWKILGALIPGILVFTMPISLLVGILVGLGRLSGDSEIVALVASGLSRFQILRPIIAMALTVAAFMLYITFNVLPASIHNLNDIKSNQSLVFQGITTQIKPRVFEESIPKRILYIEDIDRQRIWHNIFIADLSDEQGDLKLFTAKTGSLRQTIKQPGQPETPELYLMQGAIHQTSAPKKAATDPDETDDPSEETKVEASLNTEKQANRDRKRLRSQQSYVSNHFQEMTVGVALTDDKKDAGLTDQSSKPEIEELTWNELVNYSPPPEDYREWRTQIHKRISYPTACLIFALLGVGFGISHVRTGRSFGLLLGLAITIIYYLLALSGEQWALAGKLPVWLGVWQANLILATLGFFVLYLQRKPGSDALSFLSSIRYLWPAKKTRDDVLQEAPAGTPVHSKTGDLIKPATVAVQRILAARFPQLIDRLVIGDLLRFFFYILGGFTTLFIIITLFQLLNSITKHHIEWTIVANYLFFLLPFIINYVTPLAALVAVMITFGILQRTSQVVALTASGQSIYRLAAPVIIISLFLSVFLFINQDYIMPFTNPRQNNLRALIRSGQEPAQTFYQKTNQWISGVDSRIFNYEYFNPKKNAFATLNVIDLSKEPFGIKRRIFATRAVWDKDEEVWDFQDGWERVFDGDKLVSFDTFKERKFELTEQPDYFKQDLRGSHSMTIAEVRRKIVELSRAGFDVLDLRIALQSKIAFPLTCLIMAIVGLPFSFSVGKRGALYGVAIGMAIGIAYWGAIGLFEQMGRYEILPPILAAWGPNLLFGTGGIYLFLTTRT